MELTKMLTNEAGILENRPGILRPDWSSPFWKSKCDEANDDETVLAAMEDEHQHMWTWDCCAKFDGEAKWCKVGPHRESPGPRLHQRGIPVCAPRRLWKMNLASNVFCASCEPRSYHCPSCPCRIINQERMLYSVHRCKADNSETAIRRKGAE